MDQERRGKEGGRRVNQVIRFSEIVIDPHYATRDTDKRRVSRLIELLEIGQYPPPMTVVKNGKGFILIDGFHRYDAWSEALDGTDIEIPVTVAECSTEQDKLRAAISANIGHGFNYTPEQVNTLYARLVLKEGFSRKEARELLHITPEHSDREDKKIELVKMGTTAVVGEKPEANERAKSLEEPVRGERAATSEKTACWERTDLRTIRFHVGRLYDLVPAGWIGARGFLAELDREITKEVGR